MADIKMYRGGTGRFLPVWCDADWQQYGPPFGYANTPKTPPYNCHMDGIYRHGHFTPGMPVCPSIMEWQRKALAEVKGAGDILQLVVVPEDHYIKAVNFKIAEPDKRMAGATVELVALALQADGKGNFTLTPLNDIEDAMTAQGITTTIAVDKPVNVFVSLMKDDDGYQVPLYANPTLKGDAGAVDYGRAIVLGVKVLSMPTDGDMTFDKMLNSWYLVAKVEGFDCPTNY